MPKITPNTTAPFYMVLVDNTRTAKKRHATRELAEAEAERLRFEERKNAPIHILECVATLPSNTLTLKKKPATTGA